MVFFVDCMSQNVYKFCIKLNQIFPKVSRGVRIEREENAIACFRTVWLH